MKINEETTVSEEQVLFNKLSYEDQQFILKQIRMLQPCELSCEIEEKKIPEKITINDNGTIGFPNGQWTARNMDKAFAMKINSIIDYLDYLKNKGDE